MAIATTTEFQEWNCVFTNPVNLNILLAPDYEYSRMSCSTTIVQATTTFPSDPYEEVQHPTSTEANFLIKKTYTYGDITTILLLGFLTFAVLFFGIRKMFFHDKVEIHTISQKKF